jgi:hypothetical protein
MQTIADLPAGGYGQTMFTANGNVYSPLGLHLEGYNGLLFKYNTATNTWSNMTQGPLHMNAGECGCVIVNYTRILQPPLSTVTSPGSAATVQM